jgi:hypothetical protein
MANDQAWQMEIDGHGKGNDDRSLRRRIRLADAVWWQQSQFDGERITSSAIRVLPRTGISNAPLPDRQALRKLARVPATLVRSAAGACSIFAIGRAVR